MHTEWSHLTWRELRDRAASNPVVLVPLGCTETQGPYSPVGTEHLLGHCLARDVARAVSGLALPSLPYGNSDAFMGIPGTIFIRPETLTELYFDLLMSIVRSGFRRILCLALHKPNAPMLERAAWRVRQETGITVAWVNPGARAVQYLPDYFDDSVRARGHGAEPGLSLMRYLAGTEVPEDAHWEPAAAGYGAFGVAGLGLQFGNTPVGMPIAWEEFYPETGGFGDPLMGSAEIGEKMYRRLVEELCEICEALKETNVEPGPVTGSAPR